MMSLKNYIEYYSSWSDNKKCCCCILFALFMSLILANHFLNISTANYMPTRVRTLNMCIEALNENSLDEFLANKRDHNTAYYLYLTYLGNFSGIYDAKEIFFLMEKSFFVVFSTIIAAFIYKMRVSTIVSYLSVPIFFVCTYKSFWNRLNDTYFAMGMSVFIIMVFYEYVKNSKINKSIIFSFILCSGLIGICNVPRAHAGIVAEFILLIILISKFEFKYLLKTKAYKKIFAASILCVICLSNYFMFMNIIPNIYAECNNTSNKIKGFGPWHSLYIGLGWDADKRYSDFYRTNNYGIYYQDECAMEFVEQVDPNVKYLSKEYFEILKKEYLNILYNDTEFAVSSYAKKFIVCTKMGLDEFVKNKKLLAIEIFFICILYIKNKRCAVYKILQNKKKSLLIAVCLFFGGFIQPMMAIPDVHYLMGSYAVIDMVIFGTIMWTLNEIMNNCNKI